MQLTLKNKKLGDRQPKNHHSFRKILIDYTPYINGTFIHFL